MSNRERAIELLNDIPEGKLIYIIPYLEGAAIPDEIPNDVTLNAFAEGEGILKSGKGKQFSSAKELFADLEA